MRWIINLLLFVGLFMTQFYLIESGKPQISHIILLLFSLIAIKYNNKINKYAYPFFYLLFLFLLYTIIVNGIYLFIHQHLNFIRFPIFLLYNMVLMFGFMSELKNKKSRELMTTAIMYSLLLLVVFHLLGVGRYDFFPRYNGFFNDPNQMAFWAICSFSCFSFLEKSKFKLFLVFSFTVYICLYSLSRSALIGITFTFLGVILNFLTVIKRKKVYLMFLLIFLIIMSSSVSSILDIDVIDSLISRVDTTDVDEQLSVRGYDRFFSYPEYLFFGAGQGLESRFNATHEIHSTWMGFLFYYGLFGLFLFLSFLFKIFRNLNLSNKFIMLGPLFYSFSTFGARTPIFYVFLAVAIYIAYNKKIDEKIN